MQLSYMICVNYARKRHKNLLTLWRKSYGLILCRHFLRPFVIRSHVMVSAIRLSAKDVCLAEQGETLLGVDVLASEVEESND